MTLHIEVYITRLTCFSLACRDLSSSSGGVERRSSCGPSYWVAVASQEEGLDAERPPSSQLHMPASAVRTCVWVGVVDVVDGCACVRACVRVKRRRRSSLIFDRCPFTNTQKKRQYILHKNYPGLAIHKHIV